MNTLPYTNDLKGVFSHTKAEEIIAQVVGTVQRHELMIESWNNDKQIKEKERIDSQLYLKHMEQRLEDLSKKQKEFEETAALNRKMHSKILNSLSHVVSIQDTRDLIATESKSINERLVELKQVLSTQKEEMNLLRADMKKEVEEGLFKSLSVEASSMEKYAEILKTISTLETLLRKELDKVSSSLKEEISKCTKHSDMDQLILKVDDLRSSSLSAEAVKDIVQLDALLHRISNCEENSNTLFAAHETLAKHITRRLDKIQGLNDSTTKNLETCTTSLRKDLSNKTTKADLKALQTQVDQLQKDLTLASKKVDIAAQFIALYGEEEIDNENNSSH
jgi:hypothetical protein